MADAEGDLNMKLIIIIGINIFSVDFSPSAYGEEKEVVTLVNHLLGDKLQDGIAGAKQKKNTLNMCWKRNSLLRSCG